MSALFSKASSFGLAFFCCGCTFATLSQKALVPASPIEYPEGLKNLLFQEPTILDLISGATVFFTKFVIYPSTVMSNRVLHTKPHHCHHTITSHRTNIISTHGPFIAKNHRPLGHEGRASRPFFGPQNAPFRDQQNSLTAHVCPMWYEKTRNTSRWSIRSSRFPLARRHVFVKSRRVWHLHCRTTTQTCSSATSVLSTQRDP